MLNFFRRIRRNLANQNKFLQYSRYAFGEIVLVVIGILIALQINNWNENRKDSRAETNLLMGLQNEFKINLEEIDISIELNQKNIPVYISDNDTVLRIPEKVLTFKQGSFTIPSENEYRKNVLEIGNVLYQKITKDNRWEKLDIDQSY